MKKRANWLLIPALAVGLGACNKKEEAKAPDAPAAVTDAATTAAPVPAPEPVAEVTPDARAAKLGFVKYLPQDTEVVLAYYNGSKTARRLKNSKIWQLVEEQMGGGGFPDEGGLEMEDEDFEGLDAEQEDDLAAPAEEEPVGPATLFGTEFTLAMGNTTGEQTGQLLTFYRRMGYFQMRDLAKVLAGGMRSDDVESLQESVLESYLDQPYKDVLQDPQSGLALLEKAKMPPIFAAFRTSEEDRPAAAQQVAALVANLSMIGEMAVPVVIEKDGAKLEGTKIVGAKVAASMAEDRESMEEDLDAETVDRLIALVAKKDLIVASGTVGDYVVMFIGGSEDDFKLAASPADSLVSTNALAFTDAYASKELAALVYGEKEALDTMIEGAGGISDMAAGLRDGLAGAEGLGDTRDLEAMFQILGERDAALRKLAVNDALGMVAFFESGLRIETYGGNDRGMIDWDATHRLAGLGDSDGVLFFANYAADPVYQEKAGELVEALMETAYAITMKIAETPVESDIIGQVKEMAQLFDVKFRPDMVALWDAFHDDFGGSLGDETAWIIDLKGGAPAVPGIPQTVVDGAKVPRISMITPVVDRAKLSASWDKMNTTVTGTLAKISEMTGEDIPMQKPISSEKNDLVTWFFPMPFFTDDFLPSVTVGDQWFAASTSKNQALDLIARAGAGGEKRSGFWMKFDFRTLEKYAGETFKLIDENAEAITGSPLEASDRKDVQDVISLLSDLDALTVHTRREGELVRSSVHFKTR